MQRFAALVIALRVPVILVTIMLTLIAAWSIVKWAYVESDISKLLPQDDPVVTRFRDASELFGGASVGMVGIEFEDVFQLDSLQLVHRVTQELGTVEGVSLSEITLKMSPPLTSNAAKPQSLNIDKLNSALAQAIQTAKAGILAGNGAEPRLILRNLTVKVEFTVKKSGSGGVNTADLLPVGLEGTGKLSKDQTHSVVLIFKN